jgi:hypothetical protein
MNLDWKTIVAGGAVVLVIGYVLKKQAEAAVSTVAQAVNPVNPENIFYTGASSLTSAVTGNQTSLGSQIYDWLNPSP